LSQLCGLTVNNCKANLQTLAAKLAIDETASHTPTQGRTYVIHSYNAILKRRRTAGLTHYIKTRGVIFVDPLTGNELQQEGVPLSGIPDFSPGIPSSGETGPPDSATTSLVIESRKQNFSAPSSSEVRFLSNGLTGLGVTADDDVVHQLLSDSRSVHAGATVEEILDFVRLKLTQVSPDRIRNTAGYLLTAVPKCFDGEFYDRYRRERMEVQEEALRQMERAKQAELQTAVEMRRILDDPQSTEQDRLFAQRILERIH
jgi:hypothetical protein